MEVLRRCHLTIAQRLVHCATAGSTAVLGQSHKDNVRCTAVEQQPEAKEVQLSQPSSTSLLMISSGLKVQLHLPALDLTWNPCWQNVCELRLQFLLCTACYNQTTSACRRCCCRCRMPRWLRLLYGCRQRGSTG